MRNTAVPRPRSSSSLAPQRRFTPYTPHTPPLLPYPVYPVYPRGEDIPRIPPCSGYTPYTLLFWIYPVYPVYPIYPYTPYTPLAPIYPDLPRSQIRWQLSAISSAPTIALSPSRGSSGPVAVAAQPHPANPQAASRRERGTSGDPPPPRERGHFLLFTSEARQYTSTYTEVSERRVRGKRVAHRGKQAQASSRCFTYLLVECVCLLVH